MRRIGGRELWWWWWCWGGRWGEGGVTLSAEEQVIAGTCTATKPPLLSLCSEGFAAGSIFFLPPCRKTLIPILVSRRSPWVADSDPPATVSSSRADDFQSQLLHVNTTLE